jgi:DNA-binding transcriptional ArsR family regulator
MTTSQDPTNADELGEHCAEEPGHRRVAPSPVAPTVVERAAAIFRAMGDSARLRLLERLTLGEYCVTELAEHSQEGLSTISQRLRTLRAEGLVRRRRDGKHIYYTVADSHIADLIANAIAHAAEDER